MIIQTIFTSKDTISSEIINSPIVAETKIDLNDSSIFISFHYRGSDYEAYKKYESVNSLVNAISDKKFPHTIRIVVEEEILSTIW